MNYPNMGSILMHSQDPFCLEPFLERGSKIGPYPRSQLSNDYTKQKKTFLKKKRGLDSCTLA